MAIATCEAIATSGISGRFQPLSPSSGQVVHIFLTLSPLYLQPFGCFLVRLACLIHAANVRSEPGSNPSLEFHPSSRTPDRDPSWEKDLSISHSYGIAGSGGSRMWQGQGIDRDVSEGTSLAFPEPHRLQIVKERKLASGNLPDAAAFATSEAGFSLNLGRDLQIAPCISSRFNI